MSDVSEIELIRLDVLMDVVGNWHGGAVLKMMSKFEEKI